MNFWRKLSRWKKITFFIATFIITTLIILLAFINQSLLLHILRGAGIFWRSETAVIAWQALEKPFWQLVLVRFCFDFWGLFLTWYLTGLTLKGSGILRRKKGVLGKLLQKLLKPNQTPEIKRRMIWLEKKGNIFLFLVMAIPYIPVLPTAVMIMARLRKIKYSLLTFGLINFIRNTMLLWLLWEGVSLFGGWIVLILLLVIFLLWHHMTFLKK